MNAGKLYVGYSQLYEKQYFMKNATDMKTIIHMADMFQQSTIT